VIRERVTQAEAAALAKKAGEEKLAALKSGAEASGLGQPKLVSRVKPQAISTVAVPAVMKANADKLPAYVGVDLGQQGYGVYRINKVSKPAEPDANRRKAEREQIADALAEQETLAYLETLKKRAKVEVLKPELFKRSTQSSGTN
jgi:peptidyl-prolyl cis-trans isomerase D